MNYQVVTLGNPNSGKTTLFNALTGSHQQVGNWSGVTVDKKEGRCLLPGADIRLVDLPGIYSFDVNDSHSLDEQIAFSYLSRQRPDLVINVIDATTLERGLYLTLQLRELGLPVVVVLNKVDAARRKRLNIDQKQLQQALGCPVILLSAHRQKEARHFCQQLPDLIQQVAGQQPLKLDYGQQVTSLQNQYLSVAEPLSEHLVADALALRLLEQDPWLMPMLSDADREALQNQPLGFDLDLQLADTRFTWIYQLCQQAVTQTGKLSPSLTEKFDNIVLHQWLGIPVFLAVMYLMFQFSINVGSAFIDFFDILGGALFVDGVSELLSLAGAPSWLDILLAQGIGAGIQTVLTFIPIIASLYLFLSVLESSGYLARAAFVVDHVMQKIGLPGKSFVPMVMGFGCTVPAVMAARTLDKERERLITSFMSPFMSCGARLPVYALFVAAFFPDSGQNIVFLLYLCGVAAAVMTGLILRYTLLPGSSESLLLEIPDYEIPTIRNISVKTWQKLKGFLTGAGKTIVLLVTALSLLNSVSTDGRFGNLKSGESILARSSQLMTPLFAPLGVKEDNWEAVIGVITGLFAKEALVGTLNSLYSSVDDNSGEYDLLGSIQESLDTIPQNLFGLSLYDPLGLDIGDISNLEVAAEEQDVNVSTMTQLQIKFNGDTGAFAYLLFILLYTPCAAAMGAFVREVGPRWASFIAAWSMGMAFMFSTMFYQAATFADHPVQSLCWLLGYSVVALLIVYFMRQRGDVLAKRWVAP